MCGINARSVVARVHYDPERIADGAMSQFVTDSVCPPLLAGRVNIHDSVTEFVNASQPWPALVGTAHINAGPKALFECSDNRHSGNVSTLIGKSQP